MPLTPWKKLREEVLAANPRWKYVKALFVGPREIEHVYFYVQSGGAVMIIGVEDDGTIPMIRQVRPLFGKESLEFPAGGREGKDPKMMAARELAEEAKVEARHLEWIGKHEACPGIVTEAMDIFVAWGLSPVESGHDETEEFDHLSMTPAEIEEAIASGAMTNGMCISAWHQAKPRVLAIIDQLGHRG